MFLSVKNALRITKRARRGVCRHVPWTGRQSAV